jgi:hypothetical protein
MLFALILTTVSAAQAAQFTVNVDTDQKDMNPGDGVCAAAYRTCTLRAAVEEANALPGNDYIKFSSSFQAPNPPRTIVLTLGQLEINESVSILGTGSRQLAIDGNQKSRVLRLNNMAQYVYIGGLTVQNGYSYTPDILTCAAGICNYSQNVTLAYMTVRNNVTAGDEPLYGEYAGGVSNNNKMYIIDSAVINNDGGYGGGIHNNGDLTIVNSTISGNTSQHSGGGIGHIGKTLKIAGSTITGNQSAKSGAGIFVGQISTLEMINTIVADNITRFDPDISGTVTSLGSNLVKTRGASTGYVASDLPDGTDPLLGVLQNNGGHADTHELLAGSPAINAGNNCVTVAVGGCFDSQGYTTWDQRGVNFPRKVGSNVDIGAFESASQDVPVVEIGGRVLKPNRQGLNKAVVTLTDEEGVTRSAETDSQGHYSFADVVTGKAYIVKVETRHYEYNSYELVFDEARDDLDFAPLEKR